MPATRMCYPALLWLQETITIPRRGKGKCSPLQVIAPLWDETRDLVLGQLDAVTMEDLCQRARKLDIEHGGKEVPDFTI